MGTTQENADAILRRKTYIERYGSGVTNRILKVIADKEILNILGSNKSTKSKIAAINKVLAKKHKKSDSLLREELYQLFGAQVDFLKELYSEHDINAPYKKDYMDLIDRALNKELIVNGTTPIDVYESAWSSAGNNINGYIRTDLIEDSSQKAIRASISVLDRTFRRNILSAIRTAAFAVSSEADEVIYQANSDLIRGILITAVLDGRTTDFCMAIDGTIVPLDDDTRPPFHINCRTTSVPVLKSETDEEARAALDYRTQVRAGENYEPGDNKLPTSRNNIEDGYLKIVGATRRAPSGASYGYFLAAQSKTSYGQMYIKDRLGKKKGELFVEAVNSGKDPQKVLQALLVTPAKDLDIEKLNRLTRKEFDLSKLTG